MIITLKGANFSQSNIGTLDSWFISWSGSGLTAATGNVTSIKKDGTSTTTLTYTYNTENYEYVSGTVKDATGATVGSVANASGTVTVTINAGNTIKGKITITISMNYIGVGEEPEPETPVTPPSGTSTTYYFKDQSNVGYLKGGQYVESAKSATTDYIDISSKPKIGYYGRMGFVSGDTFHALEFYDSNKTYLADLSVLGTGAPAYVNIDLSDSKYANAKYVRASVSQSSYTQAQFESWYFVVGSFIEEAPTIETLKKMFPEDGYLGTDGALVAGTSSGNAYTTDYVSLSGKTNIEYKGRMGTIGLNVAFYDSSKQLISGLETIGNGSFITLNINLSDSKYTNAAYVKASISRGSLDETTWLSSSFKIS